MRNKVTTAAEAIALIRDGDTLCNAGFVGCGVPDHLLAALEDRYVETAHPKNLTLLFAAGQGDGKSRGLNRIAHDGLIKRVIGGHWGLIPKMGRLAVDGRIEAYNLPQGVISQMYRDIAAGKPGTLSKVGMGTFVDPRKDGGKLNEATKDDIVQLMSVCGEDWLFYEAPKIDVAFIRATTADTSGNLTMEREALTLDSLAMAQAARNSGGLVIAQVERIADRGTLGSRDVRVPGILVDCVVVAPTEEHDQTYATPYSAVYAGKFKGPMGHIEPMKLDERKIIARRAAFELPMNGVVNLGIGMPEGVAKVAAEENVLKAVTLTAEPGVIGGMPASGLDFGAAVNAEAVIDQNQQFDFYDGGGLDLACLGLAQCDAEGNINVSKFGPKLAGAGGFINISQNAKQVIFMGTFTAGGLEIGVDDGKLKILREGKSRKFIEMVEHVTFSGAFAKETCRFPMYITERCVFRLENRGLVVAEVAPGIDIERDIIQHMAFMPIIEDPEEMRSSIFKNFPMGLRSHIMVPPFEDRISWDPQRDLLFIDFENYAVHSPHQITAVRELVEKRVSEVGKRVNVVVNYDGFSIDDAVVTDWAAMVKDLEERFYGTVLRYTSSVFTRVKLGLSFMNEGVSPNLMQSGTED